MIIHTIINVFLFYKDEQPHPKRARFNGRKQLSAEARTALSEAAKRFRLTQHLGDIVDYVESLEALASGDDLVDLDDGRFARLESLFGANVAAYSNAEKIILLGLVFHTRFPTAAATRFALRGFRPERGIRERIRSWKADFSKFGCIW